jgi:hypothetical protein
MYFKVPAFSFCDMSIARKKYDKNPPSTTSEDHQSPAQQERCCRNCDAVLACDGIVAAMQLADLLLVPEQ